MPLALQMRRAVSWIVGSPLSPEMRTVRATFGIVHLPRNGVAVPRDTVKSTNMFVLRDFFGPPKMHGWPLTSNPLTAHSLLKSAVAKSAADRGFHTNLSLRSAFGCAPGAFSLQYPGPQIASITS